MEIKKVALIYDHTLQAAMPGDSCFRALEKLVDVQRFHPTELSKIPLGTFDLYLNIDDGLAYEIPLVCHPQAFWAFDAHRNVEDLLKKSQNLDFVFVTQRHEAAEIQEQGLSNAIWLPPAFDPEVHKPIDTPKTTDVSFVRSTITSPPLDFVRVVRDHFPNLKIECYDHENFDLVCSASKIVFQHITNNVIDSLPFEVMSHGALFVTNILDAHGLGEIFQDGIHLVNYRDEQELVEKISYYLHHEGERQQIAVRGQELVQEQHTYRHRVQRLLSVISNREKKSPKPINREHCDRQTSKEQAYYEFDRPEIQAMIPSAAKFVLDIGCGAGAFGAALKKERELTVWGIEREERAAAVARDRLDYVVRADVSQMSLKDISRQFDCIVFADVLEHLRDPRRALDLVRHWLKPEGCLIASIPNSRNRSVISSLIQGNWTYEPAGLLDEDHVRCFTAREIEKLFYRAGYRIERIQGTMLPGDREWLSEQNGESIRFDEVELKGLSSSQCKEMAIYQFLVEAKKEPKRNDRLTSMVLVTHNQWEYTKSCLTSIRHFTDEEYELIVVDNGSTDGTVKYLESMSDVSLIRNETNRGFPAAVNQGIEVARGEQILLLNNDVLVTTGWLRRLLDTLRKDGTVGLVGPVSNCVSGSQQIKVDYRDFACLDGFAWERGKNYAGQIQDVERLVGFCLLIKKEVIDKIGNLDERFGVGCYEDDDFCRRARDAGFRVVIALDSFIHHFGSRTFLGSGSDFASILETNRVRYEKKWNIDTNSKQNLRNEPAAEKMSSTCPESDPLNTELLAGELKLSLCMIVRDNEGTIEDCLKSIKPWVDEMIVVDTGSTDRTPAICREYGARVFEFPWIDDFSAARNESIRYAHGEWVFWMDSDDTIPVECGRSLRRLVDRNHPRDVFGYVMQVHCPNGKGSDSQDVTVVDHVKLFRNRPDLRFEHRIHEQIIPSIRRAGGQVVTTEIHVVHSGSDQSSVGRRRKLHRDYRLLKKELFESPEHPFVLFNMGMTLADDRRFFEALEYLRRCLDVSEKEESHRAKAYSLLVNAQYQLNRFPDALASCEEGLVEYPQDRELLFRKAMLKHSFDELEEAASIYQSILSIRTQQDFRSVDTGIFGPKTRHNLAVVYQDLENWNRAEEVWQETVNRHPSYHAGWRGWGECLLKQKKYNDILSLSDRPDLQQAYPSLPWILRCKVAEKREFFSEAIRFLEEGIRLVDEDKELLAELCRLLFVHGNPTEVDKHLERLAQLDVEDPAVWHNLACVKIRLGKPMDAVKAYRRSLEYRPNSEMTWTHLAEAFQSAGLIESAEEAFRKAKELKNETNLVLAGESACEESQ